jgi:hypothetical protein
MNGKFPQYSSSSQWLEVTPLEKQEATFLAPSGEENWLKYVRISLNGCALLQWTVPKENAWYLRMQNMILYSTVNCKCQ